MSESAAPASDRVIVALDVPSRRRALGLVDRLGSACTFYKVGLELYTAAGPSVVAALRARGKDVFLDLKLHDTPNTVARAVARGGELEARFLTVHALGGREMLAAAAEAADGPTVLLGVTVLTSLDGQALGAVLGRRVEDVGEEVGRLSAMVREVGLGGVVCSVGEARRVKGTLAPGWEVVTPGIRLPGSRAHDQRRVGTPDQAFRAGATRIVVGRPVTSALDPVVALAKMVAASEDGTGCPPLQSNAARSSPGSIPPRDR